MLVFLIIMLLLDLVYFETKLTIVILLSLTITGESQTSEHRYNAEILMVPTCVMLIVATFPIFLERLFNSTCTVESIRVIQACLHVGIYLVVVISTCSTLLAAFCLEHLPLASLLISLFHLAWSAFMISLAYLTWRKARKCYEVILEFHDFLIEYR